MLEVFKRLVRNKDEIVMEDTRTVKMFVPLSFDLENGKCKNEEDQELFDFLMVRDDVIAEVEEADAEDEKEVEETQEIVRQY